MEIIGTGFRSDEGKIAAAKLATELTPLSRLTEDTITLCHTGLQVMADGKQDNAVDKQKIIASVLLARMLEIAEAMIVLGNRGFSVEVSASLRNFIEAYFIFCNICNDAAFVPRYFNADLSIRNKLMNVASQYDDAPFRLFNEYATETVREELKDRMAAAEASELSTYSLAQAVGCQGIYDSLYRVHSAATHSTPRSLVGYVTEIDSGVVTELHRKPQMGTIPQCLFTLVDLLLNTKTFFDRLMELDKNSEVARLRRAVDAITKFD